MFTYRFASAIFLRKVVGNKNCHKRPQIKAHVHVTYFWGAPIDNQSSLCKQTYNFKNNSFQFIVKDLWLVLPVKFSDRNKPLLLIFDWNFRENGSEYSKDFDRYSADILNMGCELIIAGQLVVGLYFFVINKRWQW